MKNGLWLYFRYARLSLKSQLQYKTSFLMDLLGQFFGTIIEFFGVIVLFNRFGSLRGWSLQEVGLLYGLISIIFAVADMLNRGFDYFGNIVKAGDFDRVLLRPRSTILQLIGIEFTLKRFGRFSQGLIIFIWAAVSLNINWNPVKILILISSLAGGVALFMGLFIIQATIAFKTVESLEIMNTLTYGGTVTAQYPMTMYKNLFRKFFTFIVPLTCITYFPVISILERQDILHTPFWFGWISPCAGIAFFLISTLIWKIGIRYYTSTGS